MDVIEIVKDYLDGGFTKEEVAKIIEHHYKKGEIEDVEYEKARELLESYEDEHDDFEEEDEEKEFVKKLYGNDEIKKF